MKKILTALFASLLLVSCGGLYHTSYTNSDVRLGESKESIVAKYGQPYSEELLSEGGKQTEILCYREHMAYGHMLKTYFHFQDGVLVKKTQSDESPSKIVVQKP